MNLKNQLGDGGTTYRTTAVQVRTSATAFLTGIVAIASGDTVNISRFPGDLATSMQLLGFDATFIGINGSVGEKWKSYDT